MPHNGSSYWSCDVIIVGSCGSSGWTVGKATCCTTCANAASGIDDLVSKLHHVKLDVPACSCKVREATSINLSPLVRL